MHSSCSSVASAVLRDVAITALLRARKPLTRLRPMPLAQGGGAQKGQEWRRAWLGAALLLPFVAVAQSPL